MNPEKIIPIRNSIATRLFRIVFSWYLVIAIGVTIGHMAMEYRYQKNNVRHGMVNLQHTFEKALAASMWYLNQETLESTLEGMLKVSEIVGIKIKNTGGRDIAVGGIITNNGTTGEVGQHINIMGIDKEESEIHRDRKYEYDVFSHQFPLIYTIKDSVRNLGTVTLYSNTTVIYQRVKLGFFLLVINAMLKTLALWLIFLWFSSHLLRKPLSSLTTAIEKLSLDNLDSFKVNVKTHGRNELKILEESFNSMINNLHESVAARAVVEKAMSESKTQLQAILDNAEAMIYLKDLEGRYFNVNRCFELLFDIDRENLYGKTDADIFPADLAATFRENDLKVVSSGKAVQIEEDVPHKDGLRNYISVKFPLRNTEGEIYAICCISTDITDRKKSEKELQHVRNYLTNIIDSMPSLLVGVDFDCNITQWNAEAARVTELSLEQVVGQPLDKVIPHLNKEMDRVSKAIATRQEQVEVRQSRFENGELRFENITVFPLIANDDVGAVIRVDDVTERVRIEEMMVQSEKMLSVGGLAAGMAHEINNPLAGMIQTANVMSDRLTRDNLSANHKCAESAGTTMKTIRNFMESRDIPRMISTINASGQRVAEIVDNMLSFARKNDATVSSHDPIQLMDKILELAAIDFNLKKRYDFKLIEITKKYEANLPLIPCEGAKLQQVFLNILRNAAQAMQDAKETDGTFTPRIELRLSQETDVNMLRIDIEDNGPGMDKETIKRIFDPFFTTKPVGVGTGLGLSVSYFIITENHGGTMEAISELGKGTTFIIRLPLEQEG